MKWLVSKCPLGLFKGSTVYCDIDVVLGGIMYSRCIRDTALLSLNFFLTMTIYLPLIPREFDLIIWVGGDDRGLGLTGEL